MVLMNRTSKLAQIFTWILLVALSSSPLLGQSSGTIFLVRHAEKTSQEPDALLSEAGHKRAECLASTLQDAGIKAIFTSEIPRTQQTAEPLAGQLKLQPVVVPKQELKSLVRMLRSHTGQNLLVVGHSDTLPEIIQKLGGGKVTIGDSEYDKLFIVTFSSAGHASVTTLRYCDVP
jgi:broad specificity phosphatase PhoE